MTKQLSRWATLAVTAGCLALFSCKKDNTNSNAATDTQEVNDYTTANTESDNATTTGDITAGASGKDDFNLYGPSAGCADVMRHDSAATTGGYLHTLTVNFNRSGCGDGRTRTGILVYQWTGHYSEWLNPNRNLSINGTVTVTNLDGLTHIHTIHKNIQSYPAANPAGPYRIVTAMDTTLWSDGSTSTWTASRKEQWSNDYNIQAFSFTGPNNSFAPSLNRGDWRFQITNYGSAAGISKARNGVTYTASIDPSGLEWEPTCKYPTVAGVVTMTRNNGKPNASIDFGNGSCDNKVTITVDGHTRTIYK